MKAQKKKFDCVKMKNDIQAELMAERENYKNEDEWRKAKREDTLKNPILGPFLRKINKTKKAA
jgi:hypothetical protein